MAKRRRNTSGLGRAPAKGRGKHCVTTRKANGSATTVCYSSGAAAKSAAIKAMHRARKIGGGNEVQAVMVYKRGKKRKSRKRSRRSR